MAGFPLLHGKRPFLSVMFRKDGKPFNFLLGIFHNLCLSLPDYASVADIVLAGVVGRHYFSFDVGFETDFVILPDDVDFLAGGQGVKVDCVFLIAKGEGNKVRAAGFGVGEGETDELCFFEDGFDLLLVLD